MRIKQRLANFRQAVSRRLSRVIQAFRFRKGNVWDQIFRFTLMVAFLIIIGAWAANLWLPDSEQAEVDVPEQPRETTVLPDDFSEIVRRELVDLLETEYAWVLEQSVVPTVVATPQTPPEAVTPKREPVQPPVEPLPQPSEPRPQPEAELAITFDRILWPVKGEIASDFGWNRHPVYQDWRFNGSITLAAEPDGTVRTVLPGRVASLESGSDGLEVVIEHGSGWFSVYRSIQNVLVAVGETVKQNQQIGSPGHNGKLEYALKLDGQPVNPHQFMF